jgi:transposase
MKRRHVCLRAEQSGELLHVRDHDPRPYMRTKAAAILKVADGWPICRVAAIGLNKPYHEDTVRSWLNHYEQEGLAGLRVKQGRGRKPVFSPCT